MKKIKVYQSENDSYKDMYLYGKLRYIGESFGAVSLTNNKIYDCVGYEKDGLVRIVDDSDEDYLYSASKPAPLDSSSPGGKWEIVKLYEDGLKKLFEKVEKYYKSAE